jgi:aminoglycoside phosphotransferase (APT) family kinase protein
VDPTLAAALIEAQFPTLAPAHVSRLGEGCDSLAFEVNGEWVFRFPKSDEVARQLEIEARLLPVLGEQLRVAIPLFRFHGHPSPGFGRPFAGYRRLPGEPAIRLDAPAAAMDRLVAPLAAFLSALHAFPLDAALRAGVPVQRLDEVLAEIRADAVSDLARVVEAEPSAPIDDWRRFIDAGADAPTRSPGALVHNDFAAEHVLLDRDTQAITGVIDWSDAAISDPVVDFAGLCHWGGVPFARAVLEAYDGGLDASALPVARYLAACRGAMDVAFGLEHGRREYVTAGLTALRRCAADP